MKVDFMRPIVWAAHCTHGKPKPFINEYHIRARRDEVMQEIGDWNRRSGEDWRDGWKRARREGWRVVKVQIIPLAKKK